MKVKIVRVLFQVEVYGSDESTRESLESFLEGVEENRDQPLYEGANVLVDTMLKHASKFKIGMKDQGKTPAHDFDVSVSFNVVEKP